MLTYIFFGKANSRLVSNNAYHPSCLKEIGSRVVNCRELLSIGDIMLELQGRVYAGVHDLVLPRMEKLNYLLDVYFF